jgi:hypothetical protein
MNKLLLDSQLDFEDFAPFLGASEARTGTDPLPTGGTQITSSTGSPTVSLNSERFGVINITEAAGTDETVGLAREIVYDLQDADIVCFECRVEQLADADDPRVFMGFHDCAAPDDVWGDDVLASGSNEDAIGLRWNEDETIDIVAIDDGTLTVLKDDIGVTVERTDGITRFGFRVEKMTATQYRITPFVNGAVAIDGRINVASTSLPENKMRPVISSSVEANTAPSIDIDWIASGDK